MFFASNVKLVRSADEFSWWNTSWIYRRQINITETSGESFVDFPLEISFTHNGHVQSDGRDIRIIENSTEIPFGIAEIDSTHAKVVLELNISALSSKIVYIYYGNPSASSPNYPLVPLTISTEQQKGNATIDDRIFLGWDYVAWGVQPGWYLVGGNLVYIDNNPVVLWTDFRMDFNDNSIFEESEDVITDIQSWKGGIGRNHVSLGNFVERSYGLGDYQKYVQTPTYVDIAFADVTLRVYRDQNFVETTQADRLQMESSSWDYAKWRDKNEENIIDGIPSADFNILYNSSINPGWMAYRDSMNGRVFGGIGLNIGSEYVYHFPAKESHAFDRLIVFDYNSEQGNDPYDQPPACRIYWYADGSNDYTGINKTASMLNSPPTISLLDEAQIPEFPAFTILPLSMMAVLLVVIFSRRKHGSGPMA